MKNYYIRKNTGDKYFIRNITAGSDEEARFTLSGFNNYVTNMEVTEKELDRHFIKIEENNNKKRNVNSDILKLIEAGYEFSSFWGDTVDGRTISIDLNEEE